MKANEGCGFEQCVAEQMIVVEGGNCKRNERILRIIVRQDLYGEMKLGIKLYKRRNRRISSLF